MVNRLIGFALVVFSATVFAEQSSTISLSPEIQRGDINTPQGLWPLMGMGMGAMDSNGSSRTRGVPEHVKVLGSYYFDSVPIVADAGLGLHNEFLTEKGDGPSNIQALYTEFAGRYVFTNRWQLGAIWNTLVDNPNHYQSHDGNLATFVGAQVLKEFAWSDEYLVRVGGRVTTSLGLSGGSVNSLMAELEVSFGNSERPSGLMAIKPGEGPEKSATSAPQIAP